MSCQNIFMFIVKIVFVFSYRKQMKNSSFVVQNQMSDFEKSRLK